MIKKLPKISIITPSLNQVSYIDETIRSVLLQHYPNIEYIVIDGGSTDGTLEVLKNYSNSLTWVSGKDKGQADAINKGLTIATGDIIAYLNSDDIFLPGSLETVGSFFQDNPRTLWVTGGCDIIDEKGSKIRSWVTLWKEFWLYNQMLDRLKGKKNMLKILNFISQPATFWRQSVVKKIGLFDPNLKFVMDYDYWMRLYQFGDPGIIRNRLAAFRIHTESKTGRQFRALSHESFQVVQKYTSNPLLLTAHRIHGTLTDLSYSRIKPL